MEIVVLDGYTLNPGDLSWDALEAIGHCQIFDRTPTEQVVERAQNAEVVLTNKAIVSAESLAQLPQLKFIGVLATGYNVVDIDAATERGIPVSNIPTYGTNSVAQMVFSHLLNLTQHVAGHSQAARSGRWTNCDDWCFWDQPLVELDGLKMGIVGYGRIGRATARIARAFGMQILAYDAFEIQAEEGVSVVDLETLFCDSDVISLHCPLTAENKGFVNEERLRQMKSSAFLINTSRGPLIDEPALAHALNDGWIAGAGLDVLQVEPPVSDNPLLSAKNCQITPHIAWATRAARARLMQIAVDNVKAFQAGSPQHVVNNVT